MNAIRSIVVASAAALLAAPALAGGKYVSLEGKWSLNLDKTHYPQGFPKITKNDMNVTKDDGKSLEFTEDLTMDGKDITSSWKGAYDGKFYPTSDGQQLAWHHVSKMAAGDERKNGEGDMTGKSTCSVSKDEKTLTCQIQSFSPKNPKPVKFTEVFDKVS
ncbi:MAG TPA: hypothetical protein VKZ79_09050 [Alphaproteobacteria bacterium]|nr:hypothetical protein [Alphaproteobacteria bacterium]